MKVQLEVLTHPSSKRRRSFREAEWLATRLLKHLNNKEVLVRIEAANQPGRSSSEVQMTFEAFATKLGFQSERTGLFAGDQYMALRPDYHCALGRTGILLEVERGKTVINNNDLQAFWKCHICEHANYLFLVVPSALRQNEGDRFSKPYISVVRRLRHFFRERNLTNVWAAFVFGY
jgi:hypothetical protein